jgi:hypothetical protein
MLKGVVMLQYNKKQAVMLKHNYPFKAFNASSFVPRRPKNAVKREVSAVAAFVGQLRALDRCVWSEDRSL